MDDPQIGDRKGRGRRRRGGTRCRAEIFFLVEIVMKKKARFHVAAQGLKTRSAHRADHRRMMLDIEDYGKLREGGEGLFGSATPPATAMSRLVTTARKGGGEAPVAMDGNKDEALKCLRIGKEALQTGDRTCALKFLTKACRLDPSLHIDDFLSATVGGESRDTTPADGAAPPGDPGEEPERPTVGSASASSSSAARIAVKPSSEGSAVDGKGPEMRREHRRQWSWSPEKGEKLLQTLSREAEASRRLNRRKASVVLLREAALSEEREGGRRWRLRWLLFFFFLYFFLFFILVLRGKKDTETVRGRWAVARVVDALIPC